MATKNIFTRPSTNPCGLTEWRGTVHIFLIYFNNMQINRLIVGSVASSPIVVDVVVAATTDVVAVDVIVIVVGCCC